MLEEQLEQLLERQSQLLDKKQQLEQAVKDAASANPVTSQDYIKTGMVDDASNFSHQAFRKTI